MWWGMATWANTPFAWLYIDSIFLSSTDRCAFCLHHKIILSSEYLPNIVSQIILTMHNTNSKIKLLDTLIISVSQPYVMCNQKRLYIGSSCYIQ